MDEKKFYIGDMINMSGLTARTLQHYDNIGILPASGRTEGGRRYYTEADMMKLEQIIFYKSLGLPLQKIKENLIDNSNVKDMEKILSEQAKILYSQIESRHTSLAAIDACQEVIKTGRTPPWNFLSTFISNLDNNDLLSWDFSEFDNKQTEAISKHFSGVDELIGLYHTWKNLSLKAAIFHESEIDSSELIAQNLAKQWIDMAASATGWDEQLLNAYLNVDKNREIWPEGARKLMECADGYISDCYIAYCKLNNIKPLW